MADRSDPFDGIAELLDKLTRQLETAAQSWDTDLALDDRRRFDLSTGGSPTNLDLTDEGEAFVVTVDVPGYESADLEIRLSGETLSIRGERERTDEQADSDETYIRREREVQSFNREVRLPEPVDPDAVHATVNNGILTVRLPKREPTAESRTIDIE